MMEKRAQFQAVFGAEARRSGEGLSRMTRRRNVNGAATSPFTPSLRSALIFLVTAVCPLLQAQNAPCENTPAWSPCELVFELSDQAAAAHPNPYATVELRAAVRSPQFRTTTVPGYWDGGRRMVVRFAPTGPGRWEYQLTSNVKDWDGKIGSFNAADSQAAGFIRPANLHHWATTARNQPHLWMASSQPRFAFVDDAAFRAAADAAAAAKFDHLGGLVLEEGAAGGFSSPDRPDIAHFQRLDQRVEYLNQHGMVADLTLAASPAALVKMFPTAAARRRMVSFVAARYQAMNVTWQLAGAFEDSPGGRPLLKELGAALKELDGYRHPRSSGARVTSGPLLDDGWMDFASYGTADVAVGAIEHQLYQTPAVNLLSTPQGKDADAQFRHNLWNATVNGQYPSASAASPAAAKAMSVWFDFMSATRHWDIEPYFDLDGGRALALPGVEYIVYIEKPGPVELTVEHHNYDVFWVDPADGSAIQKKYNGEHFTGEPPDRFHDWVLHVVRQGTLEGMNRSYKFESWEVPVQEIVVNPQKIPYDIAQPTGELTAGKQAAYSVKMKRESRATRAMLWMWTAEVTSEGQGYRVLATVPQGSATLPADLASRYPTDILVKLYGMNGYGTVYMAAKGYTLKQ
jgi:hypothetical protein